MKVTVIPIVNGTFGSHRRIGTGTGGLGNRTVRDHPNYSIIKIGKNIDESPGDMRKLAVTQTPLEKPSAKAL